MAALSAFGFAEIGIEVSGDSLECKGKRKPNNVAKNRVSKTAELAES